MKSVAYIIGDIHGCYEELCELEAKIHQHAKDAGWKALIVSVGDLVDRGDCSRKVVDHFIKGTERGTHLAVLGNHEAELLRNLEAANPRPFDQLNCRDFKTIWTFDEEFALISGPAESLQEYKNRMRNAWLSQGGNETLTSYGCNLKKPETWRIPAKHIQYLLSLPLIWEGSSAVVTHALADRSDILFLQKSDAKRKTSELKMIANRVMWSRTLPEERVDPERYHVSGHTPLPEFRSYETLGVVQLDTGCVYGHLLTAFCPQTQEILDVPSRTTWTKLFS